MICCMNWTCRTHREKMHNLPKGETTTLQGSCFMKEFDRHSAGHRRKELINYQYRRNYSWNSLLCGKVYWIPLACRLKMDAPVIENFGWLSRKWDASVNSIVLEVAYNTLPVYLGNIMSFWALWWSWRKDSYNYSFL